MPLLFSHFRRNRLTCGRLLGGFVSAYEAEFLLKGKPAGSFFLRLSKSKRTAFAVALVAEVGGKIQIMHSRLAVGPTQGSVAIDRGAGSQLTYDSIGAFCKAYKQKLSFPAGVVTLESISASEADEREEGSPEAKHETKSVFSETGRSDHEGLSETCVVCMDAQASTVLLECGHICCCAKCGEKISRCPICRMHITRVVNVFRP